MADNPTIRDRGQFWRPAPDWTTAAMEREGWSARRLSGLGQTQVSGDVERAIDKFAHGAAEVGLWGLTDTDRVLVRIALDKALLVTPSPLDIDPVWRAGFVASPADDAWAIFELVGDGIAGLVAQATSVDLEAGSRSASILFAGTPTLLYRTAQDKARLHVEAPLATWLWTWLEGAE
jgi:hypothetical protein